MKKIIPVIVAVVLIIVIAAAGFGTKLLEKYSYSKERADLTEYFGITGSDDVPIILQDEQIEERARRWDGVCYFDLATVHKYFNDRFYEDQKENLLIYTLPDAVVSVSIGASSLKVGDNAEERDYVIARYEGDTLYVAADFVKEYANFSYELYGDPYHMQVYTEWNERLTAIVTKDTQVRYQGGIKSDILTDVSEGDKVVVLEQMEKWSKVKTADAFIGYVENKRLSDITPETPAPVTDYAEPVYASNTRDHKINLAWHNVASASGNDTFNEMIAGAKSVNVVAPTWFSLSQNDGSFVSYASADYVAKAHDMGLEVWAVVDNFNSGEIDTYEVLAGTSTRQSLINRLMEAVAEYGLDGINIDFENVSVKAGEPFIEFIRELSIPCRAQGIVLSVDNYVPLGNTDHYDRKEQGVVADYVIIMGYDEHYSGSDAGSVASIDYVENGIANTVAEVPPEKVINAIPFYTRIWETKGTEVTSQAVGMATAQQFLADHGITAAWDEETCQNYGESQEGDTYYQVWLEDADSIAVKLNIMENYGIAGVAEWKLGLEDDSIWDLIEEYMNR